jgi:hypothetical protein
MILALWASPLFAAVGDPDTALAIPQNIRNNQYFQESLRLANLAQLSYNSGEYDASTNYAEESVRYARLSDEYIALQLKIKETNDAIAAAKERLDWALSVGAHTRYPKEYGDGQEYYNASLTFRSAEDWDEAIDSANRVVRILAAVREAVSPPEEAVSPPKEAGGPPALPSQYTVRSWSVSRDCLWNIAGRPWVYGDPNQWRLLYNANRSKFPEPNNPDLIHPGMVLDIPSIGGETRQGMWDAQSAYSPLR